MKKRTFKRICILFIVLVFIISCTVVPGFAYSFNGGHIANTLYFYPYYGFGTTTRQHFNHAMYSWNASSGQNLLQMINSYSTHSSTNYPSNDGYNYIYRVNTGTDDYLAETQRYTTSGGSITVSADVNLNMYYSWANSAQVGKYDVWSVILHEMGHVCGLAHSNYSSAVMYKSVASNTEKRSLSNDDLNGIASLYSTSYAASHTIGEDSASFNKDSEVIIKSGILRDYEYDALIDKASLIVKAKLISCSDMH